MTIDGFQSIQPYYNNYFDMVSSNIPFGNTRVYDRDFDRSEDVVRKSSLAAVHNYFFLKGMDTVTTKVGYWPISRLRASWTRHRTVQSGNGW